jgi:WD40 repeat protein
MIAHIISIILAFYCHSLIGMEITPHTTKTPSFQHFPNDIRKQISTRLPKQHQQWWYVKEIGSRDTTKPLQTSTEPDSYQKLTLKISNPDCRDILNSPNMTREYKVQIFDVTTQEEIASFPHKGDIQSACFDSAQQLVATACLDGNAYVFDINTKQEIHSFPHNCWVTKVKFNPSDTLLATATFGGKVRLFDLETKKEIALFAHKGDFTTMEFSDCGNLLATTSAKENIRIFNIKTKKEVTSIPHDSHINSIHFHPYISTLITLTGWGSNAEMYDIQAQTKVASLKHKNRIYAFHFDPSGKEFSTLSYPNKGLTFARHDDYTLEQLNLKCLLTDWLLIEKPDKKISKPTELLTDVAKKHDCSYNELVETWKTFPAAMQDSLFQTMLYRIKKHGK